MPGRQEVRSHIRLARGFLATCDIRGYANEFELRNALSRSYYALFHACHAWLAMNNVPLSKRRQHEALIREIRNKRGKEFGDRLEGFWLLRKQADYDEPKIFDGDDLEGHRLVAREHMGRMEAEFDSYATGV